MFFGWPRLFVCSHSPSSRFFVRLPLKRTGCEQLVVLGVVCLCCCTGSFEKTNGAERLEIHG